MAGTRCTQRLWRLKRDCWSPTGFGASLSKTFSISKIKTALALTTQHCFRNSPRVMPSTLYSGSRALLSPLCHHPSPPWYHPSSLNSQVSDPDLSPDLWTLPAAYQPQWTVSEVQLQAWPCSLCLCTRPPAIGALPLHTASHCSCSDPRPQCPSWSLLGAPYSVTEFLGHSSSGRFCPCFPLPRCPVALSKLE